MEKVKRSTVAFQQKCSIDCWRMDIAGDVHLNGKSKKIPRNFLKKSSIDCWRHFRQRGRCSSLLNMWLRQGKARQGGETATEEEKNVLGTLVDVCGKAIETVLWWSLTFGRSIRGIQGLKKITSTLLSWNKKWETLKRSRLSFALIPPKNLALGSIYNRVRCAGRLKWSEVKVVQDILFRLHHITALINFIKSS